MGWELLSAILCWMAALQLFNARHNPLRIQPKKGMAFLALTTGFSLYAFGFIVVASEWFQMWQSAQWNAQMAAALYLTMIALTLLLVMTNDE